MATEYIVVHPYENSNLDPIELKKGDDVTLGEASDANGPWANWIYCVSKKNQKAGWTPIQVLQVDGAFGTAITDYTAKELTVAVGDLLYGDIERNGWLWCIRKSDEECGWVPLNCLCQYDFNRLS